MAANMHETEVVESDLVDTNLVGCLDSKALIISANSYEEVRGIEVTHTCMHGMTCVLLACRLPCMQDRRHKDAMCCAGTAVIPTFI